jgi:hypothetical protein
MVKWDLSVDSNSQKDNWYKHDIEANNFEDAINKLSKKQLKQILIEMEKAQKRLDNNRKQKAKHLFEASISTLTEFGDYCIPLGVSIESIKANSLEELIELIKKIDMKRLNRNAKKARESKENVEMFVQQKKCTLSTSSFVELTYDDVEKYYMKK